MMMIQRHYRKPGKERLNKSDDRRKVRRLVIRHCRKLVGTVQTWRAGARCISFQTHGAEVVHSCSGASVRSGA